MTWTSTGYENTENYYNEQGKDPLIRHEINTPGYESSEHYYNEGIYAKYAGPIIDGKKPSELIEAGNLTPQTIKEEDLQTVYEDILLGLTSNKDLLSKKIDLIIQNDRLINSLLSNQYKLAIEEMKNEKRNIYGDVSSKNRKFQFLTTIKMLIEKGYNTENLKFISKNETEMSLEMLLADFSKNCSLYHATNMPNASWFKDGNPPQGYDMRRVTNPNLFAGTLIAELYVKNPEKFKKEYEETTAKYNPEQRPTFEDFMNYRYRIIFPINLTYLQNFKNEREKQMQQDQIKRTEQLSPIINKDNEAKRSL